MFSTMILGKYHINYFLCEQCGLLQTEKPYWLKESYSSAITTSDTGIMLRNIEQSRLVTAIILAFFNPRGKFVDYGGGYGIFTRLMRDRGMDYLWYDPYSQNLLSRGFEYNKEETVEMVSSFETFEHFVDPNTDINNILKISDSVIFSTLLLPDKIPKPEEWWYYGLEHGQHIAFYSKKTINYLAKRHGMNYYACGSLHILTKKKISRFKIRMIELMPKIMFQVLAAMHVKCRAATDMNAIIEKSRLEN